MSSALVRNMKYYRVYNIVFCLKNQILMSVLQILTTALRIALTLLGAISASVVMDTLWTLISTHAMVSMTFPTNAAEELTHNPDSTLSPSQISTNVRKEQQNVTTMLPVPTLLDPTSAPAYMATVVMDLIAQVRPGDLSLSVLLLMRDTPLRNQPV